MAEPTTVAPWLHLSLPATVQALGPLQALVLAQAQALGFGHAVQQRMRAACDEALATILRLSHDASADADNVLQAHLGVEDGALLLRLSDNGLPYDMSLLPSYNPRRPEQAGEDRRLVLRRLRGKEERLGSLGKGAIRTHAPSLRRGC